MNLRDVLNKHSAWLRDEPDGVLVNLSGADLSGVDLSGANLFRVNLSGVDLSGADLSGADLSGADLSRADLSGADLSGANLFRANLFRVNLSGVDLYGADLSGADLSGADLSRADLSGADLSGANLSWASVSSAINLNVPLHCPEEGAFIAWKKALDNKIVKLLILETAKRSSACGRKCRADRCTVLAIQNIDGTPSDSNVARSIYDDSFLYTIGKNIVIDDFDDNRFLECAPGIHFFMTRQEAVDYTY